MRVSCGICLAAVLAGASFGQPAEGPPAFEIADVHVSAKATNPNMRGGVLRGDRYEVRTATMLDLVRLAYAIEADKVLGGPSWLESDRFDVVAKAPPSTSPENAVLMLQTLLADRFKLVVHKDSRDLPGYALTTGKKLQLKEADGSGDSGCKNTIEGLPTEAQARARAPGDAPIAFAPTVLYTCKNTTMTVFANSMRTMLLANQFLGNSQVLDRTELKGAWDFSFRYSLPIRPLAAAAGTDNTTLFNAMDKLGLKLDPIKISTPVIVVDSVNQTPSANPPGVSTKLPPPPPAEFDVADIKPSAPGAPQGGIRLQPGGRLDVIAVSLKALVTLAWNISGADEMLVGAPKWMDTDRFDVVAKAAVTPGTPVDIDALEAMIRAMIVDRFKMKTHFEDRPVTAYTLMAAKPKLTKADPSNRTGCKEGPPPNAKDTGDANPGLTRSFTCQNMSMAQFADRLLTLSGGYVRTPVLDATGIEGSWDFTFSFSMAGLINTLGGGRGGGDAGGPAGTATASDPTGGISLFDALSKQLGLKLEMQKRPLPVLVIDHVEEKPTDN